MSQDPPTLPPYPEAPGRPPEPEPAPAHPPDPAADATDLRAVPLDPSADAPPAEAMPVEEVQAEEIQAEEVQAEESPAEEVHSEEIPAQPPDSQAEPVPADPAVQTDSASRDAAVLPADDAGPEQAEPAGPATLPSGVFMAFYRHYGPSLCGEPLGEVVVEDGVPTQYFRNLVLEEPEPGRLRLKPVGAILQERRALRAGADWGAGPPPVIDIADRLPRSEGRSYPRRSLAAIRYLVIHHSGGPADMGPAALAAEHVETNGWPGIGYHFVIGAEGSVYRTQDLAVASFHVAQFNPAAVGIALTGDLGDDRPGEAQLAALADLLASLCLDLGLPPRAIRGHGEMVPTPCPGPAFLRFWKAELLRAVEERIGRWSEARALPAAAPAAGVAAVAGAPEP